MRTDFRVVWMADVLSGTPNKARFTDLYPDIQQSVNYSNSFPHGTSERERAWYDADLRILDWWRKNRNRVSEKNILFLESDVRLNGKTIDNYFSVRNGIGVTYYENPEIAYYWASRETQKLPDEIKPHFMCLQPLAVLQADPQSLNFIIDSIDANPMLKQMQEDMIFCEVRLGTIVNYLGIHVYENKTLHNRIFHQASYYEHNPDVELPGIWHPVKHEDPIYG